MDVNELLQGECKERNTNINLGCCYMKHQYPLSEI